MIASLATSSSLQGPRPQEPHVAWEAALRAVRAEPSAGPARLEDLVATVPTQDREAALLDLLSEILSSRETDPLECWLAALGDRFPGLTVECAPADIFEDEFAALHRQPPRTPPSAADYARRFPCRTDLLPLLNSRSEARGRFVLLSRLGRGAGGEVWEAYDRDAGIRRALKRASTSGEAEEALRREVRSMAGLDHAGIASLREILKGDDGRLVGVMALATGITLDRRIAAARREGVIEGLLDRFLEACDLIEIAHARGVAHADLKPGHLGVGDNGTVVLDWGAARCVEDARGEVAGTPEYMAPEQADGHAGARADVFALGGILAEILTGQPPRRWPDGVRPAEWRDIVRHNEVALLRPSGAAHRALLPALRRALAHAPLDRHASAGTLALDVRARLCASRQPLLLRLWRRLRTAVVTP